MNWLYKLLRVVPIDRYQNAVDGKEYWRHQFEQEQNAYDQVSTENSILSVEFDKLTKKHNKLNDKYVLPKETREYIKYYDGKYPMSEIVYGGMSITTTKFGDINPQVKVVDFITPTTSMMRWVKDKVGLSTLSMGDYTPEKLSQDAFKIYSEFTKYIRYITDKDMYNRLEQWLPGIIEFYTTKYGRWYGDCESLSILCLSLIRSVLPRGLFRVVAGETNDGYGHASLVAWDWRTEKWEQWETTSKEPTVAREDDGFYIKKVWFSFDDMYSWSTLNKKKYHYGDLKEV